MGKRNVKGMSVWGCADRAALTVTQTELPSDSGSTSPVLQRPRKSLILLGVPL